MLQPAAMAVLTTVGLGFLAYNFVSADRSSRGLYPGADVLLTVAIASAVGLATLTWAWVVIVADRDRRVVGGLLLSQLGKYIPGGVWQVGSQIAFARGETTTVERAGSGLIYFSLAHVVAGLAVGTSAMLATELTPLARGLALLGGLAGGALLLPAALGWLQRIPRVGKALARARPTGRQLLKTAQLVAMTVAGLALGYALVLNAVSDINLLPAFAAFAIAWTVGYAALPIPAGIGVRELVLVALLGPLGDSELIVAASVVHRLVVLAVEGAGALVGLALLSWKRRSPEPPTRSA